MSRILTVTTGKETFPSLSAQVQVSYLPGNRYGGREENLLMLSRGANKDISLRRTSHTSVSAGVAMKPSVVGEWDTSTYEVPEGLTIKVWAQRQRGVTDMALCLLEMREKAALRRISIDLTGYPRASTPVAHIEGRFDILDMEQARAAGIVPTPMITKFLTTAPKSWIRFHEVQPEIEPKAIRRARVVEDTSGKKVVITETRTRRRLAL